jgi:DNA helicase II / ATP-dependent DNA helicase PcrA
MVDQFDQQFFIYLHLRDFQSIENMNLVLTQRRRWDQSETLLKLINKITEELIDPNKLIESNYPMMKAYLLFQQLLTDDNALDFSTIQLEVYYLLQKHPAIKEALHNKIKYLMINDFQDTNTIQDRIVLSLTKQNHNH